jgi:hypothetical protein
VLEISDIDPEGRCTKSVYVSHAVRTWALRIGYMESEGRLLVGEMGPILEHGS